MNETLQSIFENVNDWLKFAEAKHSGLIALASGILLATPAILKQPKNKWWRAIFIIPALFLGTTVMISLASFSPVLKKQTQKASSTKGSIYFFEDISHQDTASFRKLVITDTAYKVNAIDRDLMEQIIINSRITSNKMKSFKCSLSFFRIGFILMVLLFLGKYVFQKENL